MAAKKPKLEPGESILATKEYPNRGVAVFVIGPGMRKVEVPIGGGEDITGSEKTEPATDSAAEGRKRGKPGRK